MKNLKDFKDKLGTLRPADWEMIPDIDLYMDQVISYMQRQHIGLSLDDGETLTSAMINNYIKSGLLPRAKGKKYNRDHIGYLTAICLLKQVLSVGDTGTLLESELENSSIEEFYNVYTEVLDDEFMKVSEKINEKASHEDLAKLALQLSISSYAQKLACEKILKELMPDTDKEKKK